jgi:NNP family nitrate/nitrite transporter-like MFS transporter
MESRSQEGAGLQLALSTAAFAACFAVFGSLSAMMPDVRKLLGLTDSQKWLAISLPVLLGSVGRLPLGILADRLGGRPVFAVTLVASIVPVILLGLVHTYPMLLVCGFLVGIALASFSVGVSFVSPWYPASRQGYALGVYGAGNAGQAIASFGAPVVVGWLGYQWGFWAWGVLAALVLVLWLLLARDAPQRAPAKSWGDYLRPLARPRSWALSLYYFLTFGGFVAMALSLPLLLTEQFHLGKVDAGFRTAGFIALATACRPLGGVLSDRIGGARVLSVVFPATAVCALLMARPSMDTFTVGALGMAAAIGLGNGAVFKLVPEFFPTAVGSVTGLVGAAGGLGGFFPPLVLGELHHQTGSYAPGFVCLSAFALLCLGVLVLTRPRRGAAVAVG